MTKLPISIKLNDIIINVLLVSITTLSIMNIYDNGPATNGLDASYLQSMGYYFKQHLQAGVDYVFNFGILGYFYSLQSCYDADLFYWYVFFQLTIAIILSLVLITRIYNLTTKLEKFLYLFALLIFTSTIAIPGGEPLYMLSITIATILALKPPYFIVSTLHYYIWLAVILLFLAGLSLAKFTYFILACFSVLIIAINTWHSYSKNLALTIIGIFLIFQLGIWISTGQSVFNIPAFLINSLQLTSGHNEAMQSLAGNFIELRLVAVILFSMLTIITISYYTQPIQFKNIMLIAMLGISFFFAWKAGFVRHDVHSITFFDFTLLIPFFIESPMALHKLKHSIFVTAKYVVVTVSIIGIFSSARAVHYKPYNFLARWNENVVENFNMLMNLHEAKKNWNATVIKLQQQYNLPQIRAVVGHASVDIFSWEQGIVLLNNFNWQPRPVFQSYITYTPQLLALNSHFYQSSKAPEFVLFKLQTIDNRFPLMDDIEAFKIIIRDYGFILSENGYLLLKHQPVNQKSIIQDKVLLQREIRVDELIDLSYFNTKPLTLSLIINKSLVGNLYSLLYKLPLVFLELSVNDGTKITYRIIPNMLRSGIIINPLINNQMDLLDWYNGRTTKRVLNLRLITNSSDEKKWFQEHVILQLNELKTIPRTINGDNIKITAANAPNSGVAIVAVRANAIANQFRNNQ